jgi:type IV pilus assembly protein PilB
MTVSFNEDEQKKKLLEIRAREEEDLAQFIAEKLSLPYINAFTVQPEGDALSLISEKEASEAQAIPFEIRGKKVILAVVNPNNDQTKKVVEKIKNMGFEVIVHIISPRGINHLLPFYKEISLSKESEIGAFDVSSQEIRDISKNTKTVSDLKNALSQAIKTRSGIASKILETMLGGAIAVGASDVHIEPEEKDVVVRYRLDGVLNQIGTLDYQTFHLVLSRVKILSGLKLNIKNISQDGRFTVKFAEKNLEIRTSIVPGAYEETIVMRLLDPDSIKVSIEDLGLNEKLLKIIEEEIKKPQGMILTTGPTGSGKTTTLYAFLSRVKDVSNKIITIENPIEYKIDGIVQTQVENEKGYTFTEGLKAALRQDPDIIMVGEIRDKETAKTAIDAALTGHLVFSTLHTNNAAGVFPRLIDLGVNPKVISSAVTLSLAQRLVRKLCQFCKKEIPLANHPSEAKIRNVLSNMRGEKIQEIPEKIYQAVGCDKCGETGYKGRIGVFEGILTNEKIDRVIREIPSEREIEEASRDQGIYSMKEDGIIKVFKGITSIEELERVVDIS